MSGSFTPLTGLDILLVEDESLVSFLLEDMLSELGAATIRHASRLEAGFTLAREKVPQLAVLDVNLAGEAIFPLAEKLVQDHVPIVFISGYGREGLSDDWSRHEVLQKPMTLQQLDTSVRRALAGRRPAG